MTHPSYERGTYQLQYRLRYENWADDAVDSEGLSTDNAAMGDGWHHPVAHPIARSRNVETVLSAETPQLDQQQERALASRGEPLTVSVRPRVPTIDTSCKEEQPAAQGRGWRSNDARKFYETCFDSRSTPLSRVRPPCQQCRSICAGRPENQVERRWCPAVRI